jgi:serine/threonine protein phosphatase 1
MTRLTYAVGDIHGRLDLLLKAIEAIEGRGDGSDARIVMLGDYVDRGPHSRQVVEYLIANAERLGMVCLKGNHEAMMVSAIRGADLGSISHWMRYGGEETMKSYGWAGRHAPNFALVPREHLDWMASLPVMMCDRHRVFVHAGLDPDKNLQRQDEAVCLWIRDRFLNADLERVGLHVVHGHTPEWSLKTRASEPELLARRTNLDTGAYYTGVLTVGVFADESPGGPVDVLTIRSDPKGQEAVSPRWRVSDVPPDVKA